MIKSIFSCSPSLLDAGMRPSTSLPTQGGHILTRTQLFPSTLPPRAILTTLATTSTTPSTIDQFQAESNSKCLKSSTEIFLALPPKKRNVFIYVKSPSGASSSAPLAVPKSSRLGNLMQFLIGLNIIAVASLISIGQYQNQYLTNNVGSVELLPHIGVANNGAESENRTNANGRDYEVANNISRSVGVDRESRGEDFIIQDECSGEGAFEGGEECGDGSELENEPVVTEVGEGGSEGPGQAEYEVCVEVERQEEVDGKELVVQVEEEHADVGDSCVKGNDASTSGGQEHFYVVGDGSLPLIGNGDDDNQGDVEVEHKFDGDGTAENKVKNDVENDEVEDFEDFEDWVDCQGETEGGVFNENIIEREEENGHFSDGEGEREVGDDCEIEGQTKVEDERHQEQKWHCDDDEGNGEFEEQVEVQVGVQNDTKDEVEIQGYVDGDVEVMRGGQSQYGPVPLKEINVNDMEIVSCVNEIDFSTKTFLFGWEMNRGTFGVVSEMFDIDTGDSVAVKTIKTVNLNEQELIWTRKEISEHLKLKHTNIVELYGAVKDSSFYYLVMEKCDRTLTKGLRQLPVCRFANVVGQINSGLEYIHMLGMVHRDIKPDNLLVAEHGQVKICDFGSVGLMDQDGIVSDGQVLGTPNFAAPEVLLELSFGKAADYYSVGVMMFFYFAGEYPFEEFFPDSEADLEIAMDVPESTKLLLIGLLKYDSEERFGSEEVRQWVREQK